MTRAIVIGAGIAGLTAAYRLASAGVEVSVFEQEPQAGGLASSFDWRGAPVDRNFHFICAGDAAYLDLLTELGMAHRVKWAETRMGHYRDGVRHDFGTPGALLSFPPLRPLDRARFGLSVLMSRGGSLRDLDGVSARDWVIAEQGHRSFDVIWRPLLEMKFGVRADDVSAAWLRERIRRLATSRPGLLSSERLGFVSGGTRAVVERLALALVERGGSLRPGSRVDAISVSDGAVDGVVVRGVREPAEIVVSTIATPGFLALMPGLPDPLGTALRSVEYLGVVCWAVFARRALTPDFWLNVDDRRVPFPGVVTFTNLDPMPHLGAHLHYIPIYMPTDAPLWDAPEDTERARVLSGLDVISPGFSRDVIGVHRSRDCWAQPVFDVGFGARLSIGSSPLTPVRGLFRTDMGQTYPHDRSLVNAVTKGTQAARGALAATYTG